MEIKHYSLAPRIFVRRAALPKFAERNSIVIFYLYYLNFLQLLQYSYTNHIAVHINSTDISVAARSKHVIAILFRHEYSENGNFQKIRNSNTLAHHRTRW